MIPLGHGRGGTPAIAVVDPLCPACKGFDERMRGERLYAERLEHRGRALPARQLVQLDGEGLAAPRRLRRQRGDALRRRAGAQAILDWAFTNQEELRDIASRTTTRCAQRLEKQFPKVKGCLGSAQDQEPG